MRYLVEHGAELVAAFDINEKVIGKDVGEIAGIAPLGVKVSNAADADAVIKETRPDVGVIATMSTMADVEGAFTVFAQNGVNAIFTWKSRFSPGIHPLKSHSDWTNSRKRIIARLQAAAILICTGVF